MKLLLLSLVASLLSLSSAALPLEVATPTGFTKLRSWGKSSLYAIEASTSYDHAPLLVHLTGSRYGMHYCVMLELHQSVREIHSS